MMRSESESMGRLKRSAPIHPDDTLTVMSLGEEKDLLLKVLSARSSEPEATGRARIHRTTRSLIVGVTIAVLAVGGGLAAAATIGSTGMPAPLPSWGTTFGTSMVYFPPEKEIVLFGGAANESTHTFGDTWVLNSHGWKELHPAVSPTTRAQYAMAYDPKLGEIVLYGGCTYCGAPGYRLVQDTWAFNGTTWHELHSDHVPTYEPSPLLAWDTATQALELLAPPPGWGPSPPNGDFNSNGGLLGRWVWGASGWTWDRTMAGPPLFISASAFVAKPGSNEMLYFSYQPYSGTCPYVSPPVRHECGWDPTGLNYSQTWSWNGLSFTKEHPTRAPTSSQAVTADPHINRVIAIAGSHVWEWTGSTWLKMASTVPSLSDVTAAYDPAIGDVIVWGMQMSGPHTGPVTWAWNGNGPTSLPAS